MLVKVKVTEYEEEPDGAVIIHNKSRSFKSIVSSSPRIKGLLRGRLQAFFEIKLDDYGGITFESEAPTQDW